MKSAFEQKILIQQNFCLVSKLNEYRSEICFLKKELEAIKKGKGLIVSVTNQIPTSVEYEFKINIIKPKEDEQQVLNYQ